MPSDRLRDMVPAQTWKRYDDAVDKAHSVGAMKPLKDIEAEIGRIFINAAITAQPEAQVTSAAPTDLETRAWAENFLYPRVHPSGYSLAMEQNVREIVAFARDQKAAARLAALEVIPQPPHVGFTSQFREGYRAGIEAYRQAIRALAAKEQPPMKRLPCGCLANNLSRCPVHGAP